MSDIDDTTYTAGIAIGTALVVLGVVAYALSDFASATALIPSIFGVAFVALGQVGRNTDRRAVAVYGLGVLALLGLVGSFQGITDVISLATGGDVDRPVAAVSQAIMALFSLVVLVLVGRSAAE
ncbi:hypothetical protein [Natronobiforma cellulositropha]|uniref:hypothetical protein n=1 Tax=Natronobiforma cellulositropha TaxID=1679076 RepID=UPI0021D5801D|nr:hypothetical protein [Natronobiforma cellulositropha]